MLITRIKFLSLSQEEIILVLEKKSADRSSYFEDI